MSASLTFPCVMGILNCTPDSFFDGGQFYSPEKAFAHAEEMIAAGVGIIDVGGESTRPGAIPVSEAEELARVLPVITQIKKKYTIPLSVDTSSPLVMQHAIEAGVDWLNDVRAFQNEAAFDIARQSKKTICIMHMQGTPATMQIAPHYQHNVVEDVYAFLKQRIQAFRKAGFQETIVIDPGFGFGKTLEDNLKLLKQLSTFKTLACPVLVGLSRKSMLGQLTLRNESERLAASIAAQSLALWQGADIIRTHDVKEAMDAMKVVRALQEVG